MRTIMLVLSSMLIISSVYAQKTLGVDTLENHNNHQSWVGEYEYTDEASGIHYDLMIEDTSGILIAIMEVESNGNVHTWNGHFQCEVDATQDAVVIKYLSHSPFHNSSDNKQPEKGAVLLRLLHREGALLTDWQTIVPPDFDNAQNNKSYFKVLIH